MRHKVKDVDKLIKNILKEKPNINDWYHFNITDKSGYGRQINAEIKYGRGFGLDIGLGGITRIMEVSVYIISPNFSKSQLLEKYGRYSEEEKNFKDILQAVKIKYLLFMKQNTIGDIFIEELI